MGKDKKKFKETAVGKFLAAKAPNIVDMVGDAFPPVKLLQNLIGGVALNPADKATMSALMLEYEKEVTERMKSEDAAITGRWEADMKSDSWLSKNTRPLVLLSLIVFMFIVVLADSIPVINFDVKDTYVDLLKMLLNITIVAYFGSRGVEKVNKIRQK